VLRLRGAAVLLLNNSGIARFIHALLTAALQNRDTATLKVKLPNELNKPNEHNNL